MRNTPPLCFPRNYDNYSVNDIILTISDKYDVDKHISVVLCNILRGYVVNSEVADFTFLTLKKI